MNKEENAFQSWIDLSIYDIRGMLFALIGRDFGDEPEKYLDEIRLSRKDMMDFAASALGITKTDAVIDLGSGCGFGTYWLSKHAGHVCALDISETYLQFASNECKGIENISFHHIQNYNLNQFEDASIDAVISISVFIHLNLYDIYLYFREFSRIIKDGGKIWLDIADPESLDFNMNGQHEDYFLRSAEIYRQDTTSLPGLMNWNSIGSVRKIAEYFQFFLKEKSEYGYVFEKIT